MHVMHMQSPYLLGGRERGDCYIILWSDLPLINFLYNYICIYIYIVLLINLVLLKEIGTIKVYFEIYVTKST